MSKTETITPTIETLAPDTLEVTPTQMALGIFGLALLFLLWRINVNTRRTYLILNTSNQPKAEHQQSETPPSLDLTTKVECPWLVEGETRQGQIRSENQDALALGETKDGYKFQIVCDGAGGHAGGREASQIASKAIAGFLKNRTVAQESDKRLCLDLAIEAARLELTERQCQGITTAIVCLFDGCDVHYATLGDGGLSVLWPDGMVQDLLVEHHALNQPKNVITAFIGQDCDEPPRVGTVRMEPGAILFSMSDGVSDLLDIESLAPDRHALGKQIQSNPQSITKALLNQIEQARHSKSGAYLHSDNLTLSLAHLPKGD